MHKDTAKWLLGLVPVSTLAGLGLALAPRFDSIREIGPGHWINDHQVTATAVAVTVLAVLVLVAGCSYVLLAAPSEWARLRDDANWLSDAFSKYAVGRPFFLDSSSFARAEVRATSNDPQSSSDERAEVARTTQRILELSETMNARARFKRFAWAYLVCTTAIVGGVGTVIVALPDDRITEPAPASLYLADESERVFVSSSGCSSSQDAIAVAVGGSWDDPNLRLYGPGCTTDAWIPPDDLDIVVVPK